MKRLSISLSILFSVSFLFAQEKTVEIPLIEKTGRLMDLVHVPGKGILLKTGCLKALTKKVCWELHFYDEMLEKKWVIPIEKDQAEKGYPSFITASEHSNYIYHIEVKEGVSVFAKTKYQVTQVLDKKKKVFADIKIPEGSRDAIFVRNEDLVLFMSNTLKDGKKTPFTFHKFSHQTFKRSIVKVDLPKTWEVDEFYEEISDWYPIYHDNESIHMVRKANVPGNMRTKRNHQYLIQVAKLNYMGKLEYLHTLNGDFEGWNFVAAHDTYHKTSGTHVFKSERSYRSMSVPSGNSANGHTTSSVGYVSYNAKARGRIVYDASANQYVLYGIYNEDIEKGKYYPRGFFIKQYNENGDKINEQLIPIHTLAKDEDMDLKSKSSGTGPTGVIFQLLEEQGYQMLCATQNYWYKANLNRQLEIISLKHGVLDDLTEVEKKSFSRSDRSVTRLSLFYLEDIRIPLPNSTIFVDVNYDDGYIKISKSE